MSSIILSDKAMSYRSSPTSSPYQFKRMLSTPTLYNRNNCNSSTGGRNSALLDILDQAERIASMPSPKRRNTQHSGHERTTTASVMGIESDETWMDFCEDLPLTSTDAEEEEDEQQQKQ